MKQFTNEQKAECAKRELGLRTSFYKKQVENGKMTQTEADREIALMQEIMMDYLERCQPSLFVREEVTHPTPAATPVSRPEGPSVNYATPAQKEEILWLLNFEVITRVEKTKMLLNISRIDEDRATQAIAKMRVAIEERSQVAPGPYVPSFNTREPPR